MFGALVGEITTKALDLGLRPWFVFGYIVVAVACLLRMREVYAELDAFQYQLGATRLDEIVTGTPPRDAPSVALGKDAPVGDFQRFPVPRRLNLLLRVTLFATVAAATWSLLL
jgi:hypothetical protein